MELGLESIDVVAPSVPRDVGLNEGLDPGFIGTWKGDCGLQSADFSASDGLPEVFEEGYGLILGEGFVGNGVRADAYEVSSPDSDVAPRQSGRVSFSFREPHGEFFRSHYLTPPQA